MENLGIDKNLLFAQLVNFIVFFLLYKEFVAKKFLSFLKEEKRKNELLASLDQEIVNKRRELDEERKKLKVELKKETDALKKNIIAEVEEQKKKILEDAKKEAVLIRQQAKNQIEEERIKMEVELKKRISDMIVSSIEFALKDYLTEEQQRQIVTRVLKNFQKAIN
jgi:F-type H+-transporting ATPase subunit b